MKKGKIIFFILVALIVAGCLPQVYGSVVYFDTANPSVQAGETISVAIFSTEGTNEIRMDKISDNAGGTASNLWINPTYANIVSSGTLVNSGNVLIKDIKTLPPPVAPQVWGTLYTFDYLVPNVSYGTTITIFADSSNGAINYVYVTELFDSFVTPESLTLTVVPEPASILLFLLGAVTVKLRKNSL